MLQSYSIKDLLKIEVAPALGCTEPTAAALCSASAKSLLQVKNIDRIELWVDANVYKNGMGVAIPGARGAKGIGLAAALGVICGNPELKLEVLQSVNDKCLKKAETLVSENRVLVDIDRAKQGIFIKCIIRAGGRTAEAVIEELHDNLTELKLNGKTLDNHPLLSTVEKGKSRLAELEDWLKQRSLEDLVSLLEDLDDDDLAFVKEGLDHNLKLAKYGLTYGNGLGIGKTLERLTIEGLLNKDMILSARILTSAAADARMAGVKLPAMSSAGSGNHGLTAVLPIWAVQEYLNLSDEEQVLPAIALSHVVTAYIKAFTGRLSAICGCSVAAGAGATAGVTYLMGGNIGHIAGAIKTLIGDLAGVICDGAKSSCALKLATAAGAAVQAALFALHGIQAGTMDGIIAGSAEQTMQNVGKLSSDGMIETDRTILQIMIDNHIRG